MPSTLETIEKSATPITGLGLTGSQAPTPRVELGNQISSLRSGNPFVSGFGWKKPGVGQPGGPGSNYLGISFGAKDYAAQTKAALARRDFEEFNQTYLPLLERQLGTVNNPNYLRQQVAGSRDQVGRSLAIGNESRERQFRSYGLTPTSEQRQTFNKGDRLRASLADVSAINRTTQQVKDRDLAVLSGAQGPQRSYSLGDA